MFASTKIIGVDKILASTKFSRRQKSRVNKMLAQAQKNLFTAWLGRVHSSWLLPDLADDLLSLPEGVDSLACSPQVWCCLWSPCFYGRTLSRTVPACCTSQPCRKHHKFWRRQNIGADKISRFHLFSPNYSSCAAYGTFRYFERCSVCLREGLGHSKPATNPWNKHNNTTVGISTISNPYWTVFYRIKWALQVWVSYAIYSWRCPVCS